MHSHAERGNDRVAGAVEIVPHAPRGNAARDAPRSASGGGRRASRDAFPRRAWERSGRGGCGDRSSRSAWECRQGRSAFRFWRVTQSVTGCMPTRSVGTIRLRGLWRSFLTLRVGMPPGTLRVPLLEGDAERHGMHAHAERRNDQLCRRRLNGLALEPALFDHAKHIRHILYQDPGNVGDGVDVTRCRITQAAARHQGQVIERGVQAFAGTGVEFGGVGRGCRSAGRDGWWRFGSGGEALIQRILAHSY